MKLKLTRRLAAVFVSATIVTALAEIQTQDKVVGVELHVAINGSDHNPGTAAAPFATLVKARAVVSSEVAKSLSGDVRVVIHGGIYQQYETLTFGPEDSGNEKYSITYAAAPGEKVVFSGGRRITGWKQGAGGIWTAEIPEVRAGQWYFRQLFVGGRRATRARTPNAGAQEPWWQIATSSASKENPPAENGLLTVKVTGPIQAYRNPGDVELVYMQNNESARKRLEQIDEPAQSFTLAPPHRWNPRVFTSDWYLSIPLVGKPCYLENAREMLDEPGEWYLDRTTGTLSYWPLPGEDLNTGDVVAPVLQNTMLAVQGAPGRPVVNLHFDGLHMEYVDWPLPPWGYMAMFCCNVADTAGPKPGHRPIEAVVEFSHARMCSFADGEIAHGGAMGICLREGTAQISVEGNDVGDLGGGGIAFGWPNSAAGYIDAAPPPQPGEFSGYRITNNHVHHCGMDYYGAVGILMFPCHQSRVAHNLIHHTAYIGIAAAGSQDPKVTFDGDNFIEYNHIHDAMMTTIDGAGIYVTFPHHGQGTLVRGNLVHDTHGNPNHHVDLTTMRKWQDHPPSAGFYLDGNTQNGLYQDNVLYRNLAAGPVIFNYEGAREKNQWVDNIFAKNSMPPAVFLGAIEALTGLEPVYRSRLLNSTVRACMRELLKESSAQSPWSALQYRIPANGDGVVQIIAQEGAPKGTVRISLRGLEGASAYDLSTYSGPVTLTNVWGPGQMPMIDEIGLVDPAAFGLPSRIRGSDMLSDGLTIKLGDSAQVIWIAYRKVN